MISHLKELIFLGFCFWAQIENSIVKEPKYNQHGQANVVRVEFKK